MDYTNFQPTPVYSSDEQPLMPCHPARARRLLRSGRAVPHHVKGIFGIRMTDRTRADSQVQEVSINVDPGSQTTGIAIVADNGETRRVIGALEIHHRAFGFKAKITRRRSYRRTRRGRLRYRKPRFKNRKRAQGTLPPSVDSLRIDTLRIVRILRRTYPITAIRIERNKFDTQLMLNPDITGIEYQQGTLMGSQVRAYIYERDNSRCVYCGTRRRKLQLDHARPRAIGSNRVDNLILSCQECNLAKRNRPIEEFLANKPELLKAILDRVNRSNMAGAAHINAVLPALVRSLEETGLPVHLGDAASATHHRRRLNIRKTHCYDAALLGIGDRTIRELPGVVLHLKPQNGNRKQRARVDKHGTPTGAKFRADQKLPKHLRQRNPAAGHSGKKRRYGDRMIGTGDIVQVQKGKDTHVGRAVVNAGDGRIRLSGTNPAVTASIRKCKLIARNPGHIITRGVPSQQKHADEDATTTERKIRIPTPA